jgi:hypothetical protein
MQFKGHLLLPDEPGPGLRVNLDVAAHHLAVESDGGGLGAWPLETVVVERLQGDIFALTVAGEPLRFVADDTIAFAYSGVPTIERVSRRPRSRSGLRSVFDRIWNGPDKPAPPVTVEPPSVGPVSVEPVSVEAVSVEPVSVEPLESVSVESVSVEPVSDDHRVSDDEPDVSGLIDEYLLLSEEPGPSPACVAETSIPLIGGDDEFKGGDIAIAPTWAPGPEPAPAGEDLAGSPGCPGIRSDGRRCESPILTASGYCYAHDPKRAFEDKYQAAQQARAQLKREATARLNRIYGRLDKAMRQVERGELDPETAMAMAQIASTMCAILGMEESPAEDLR